MSNFDGSCSQFGNEALCKNECTLEIQTTDVLICGRCSFHCSDIKEFISHKDNCQKNGKPSPEKLALPSNLSPNIFSTAMKTIEELSILRPRPAFSSETDSIQNASKTIRPQTSSSPATTKFLYDTFSDLSGNLYMIENNDKGRNKEKIVITTENEEPSILMLSEEPSWENELVQAKKLSVLNCSDEEDVGSYLATQMIQQPGTKLHEDTVTIDPLVPTDCCEVELQSSILQTSAIKSKIQTMRIHQKKTHTNQLKDQPFLANLPAVKNSQFLKMCSYVDGGLKCSYEDCNFITKYKKNILRHSSIHTGKKPFSCSFCDATFSRRDKQKLHEKIHGQLKLHVCTEAGCTYKSVDNNGLVKHKRIHSNERPHTCQLCSYSAKDSSQLIVHLRSHTGDTPYHCQQDGCNSAFMTSSDLKRHSIIHTGLKPFVCSFCGFASNVKQNLNVHVKLMHSDGTKYNCKPCTLKFSNGKQLREHKRTNCKAKRKSHRGKRIVRHEILCNFVCDTCNSTFVREDSYSAHMRQHQQIRSQDSSNKIKTTLPRKLIIQENNFTFTKNPVATESDINPSITAEQTASNSANLFDSSDCVVSIDGVQTLYLDDKSTTARYTF